jgi:hypothetical protein
MAYTTETIDLSETRKILMQAIMSTEFLKQIRGFADTKLLTDTYSKYILQWCFEFYDQFQEAPKQAIQSIYENKSAYVLRESDAKMIEDVLASISSEFIVQGNTEYYVEQAELYFNKLGLKKLVDEIGKLADKGRIDEAINKVAKFRKVDRLTPQGVDLLDNDLVIDEAFNDKVDALFKFPGPLGEVLGSFNRGDLSAVIGPQKRGKSFMLMETATYAMQMGLKVWFISLEMTRNQVVRRMWQQWMDSVAEPQTVTIPYFDEEGNICERYEEREPVPTEEMVKMRRKFRNNLRDAGFKIYYYPKNNFKVTDLKILLENQMLYHNEIPDMVVIDYASIMAPERHADKRFELDQIWADLSSVALQFNIHIMTASQANKNTFGRDIEQGDSAEANSITAHVALMFALNQTPENKRQHCMRVATMFARHKEFQTDDQVVLLQNLSCAKGMMEARMVKDVPNLLVK